MLRITIYLRSVNGPELNLFLWRFNLRLSWGQVALWYLRQGRRYDYRTLAEWLNPLVWCRHGAALLLRGKPIERAF